MKSGVDARLKGSVGRSEEGSNGVDSGEVRGEWEQRGSKGGSGSKVESGSRGEWK